MRYKLARQGQEFETPLVTAPAEKPTSIENYLRVVGLLYLFIGLFIFARRWNAPKAVHFYVFCLVSFILYSFHYSGKLDSFRSGSLLGKYRGAIAGARAVVALRAGFPGPHRSNGSLFLETADGISAAAGACCWCTSARRAILWDLCPGSVRAFCWTRSN